MNDEERIEEFSEPPKKVRIKDIRICIMEKYIDGNTYNSFLYAYPYAEEAGGVIKVINPYYTAPKNYRELICDNKLLVWQAFHRVKRRAINSGLKLIYDGPILRDESYGTRKFK